MDSSFTRRGARTLALAFLALSTSFAAVGCGGDGDGLSGPMPSDPGPSDPGPANPGPQGPAPVGDVVYAVDLANNFMVFGTGSVTTPTLKKRITGVPILKRIIGLAIRPSDNALIGVGNDSRVYTIDPLTAKATPVSESPFSPQISSFFDIHFAMALEPNGQRIRLIAAESGGNWSIDISDGSATLGPNAKYGDGSALEGRTPRLLGLVYPTLPDSAKQAGWCGNLAYALDADEAIMLASCDPGTGLWWPTGESPEPSESVQLAAGRVGMSVSGSPQQVMRELKDQLLRCGEFLPSPGGSESDGEPAPPAGGGPWFPRSPDTEFYAFLVKVGEIQARPATVKLIDAKEWGINWHDPLPADDPIQSGVFAVGGPYGPSQASAGMSPGRFQPEIQLSAAGSPEQSPPPAASSDPRASCTNS